MRRILPPLLFGLIGAAILVSLGIWQLQRLDWKRTILAQIEITIAGPAQPLPVMISPSEQLYMPVALTGQIGAGELAVLVSVKQRGAGWRIIAPFTTHDGRRILIDRGFAGIEAKGAQRSLGAKSITGNLHWPQDRNKSTPENDVTGNTWFARDIAQMAETLDTEPLLVVIRSEDPADPALTPLPVSASGIPNDHLQYAITWFSLALIWLVMTAAFLWRGRGDKKG